MGGRFNITAYVMNATLLQMATMRRLTMSFMPNAANTKAEATNPMALQSVTIALCATVALCITPAGMTTLFSSVRKTINGPKMIGGALALALPSPSGRHRRRYRADVRTYRKSPTLFQLERRGLP
jgi:hypothetical protein